MQPLYQLHDSRRLPGQRHDPPEHCDQGDAQGPQVGNQPCVSLLIAHTAARRHEGQLYYRLGKFRVFTIFQITFISKVQAFSLLPLYCLLGSIFLGQISFGPNSFGLNFLWVNFPLG